MISKTEFQPALGITQMKKLERIIEARRRLASNYNKILKDTSVLIPQVAEHSNPVFQSYVVLIPENAAPMRKKIIDKLKAEGIETAIGTWNMPMTTYYRTRYGFTLGDVPSADKVFGRALTLPLYVQLLE